MSAVGRYALIVAVDDYGDEKDLGRLHAPAEDAAGLAEVLGAPHVGGFDVEVLTNPDSYTLRRRTEDFFADRSLGDTLLLHFAGHGVRGAGGKLFLATTDTRRKRLESTAVPAEYVGGLMMSSRAQRIALLLDCCFSGAIGRGMFSRADSGAHVQDSFAELRGTGRERGRAVLTASNAVEYAFEGDQNSEGDSARGPTGKGRSGPSLFTGALIEGLRTGTADLDGDGQIGLSELAEYITHRIHRVTPHQNPQLWMFGAQGDLVIARAARRTIPAAELPEQLAAAVTSPEQERRLWVVSDLARLLHGADVSLARTACTALTELSHDDSRRIAEMARQTLADAAPRVASHTLDLGRVAEGGHELSESLPVGGPPLVRATLQAVAEPWLRVAYVPEGVSLSLVAPARGTYEGVLILRCATGDATIRVTAVVTEAGTGAGGRDPGHAAGAAVPPPVPPMPRSAPRGLARIAPVFAVGTVVMGLVLVLPFASDAEDGTQYLLTSDLFPIGVPVVVGAVLMGRVAVLCRAERQVVRRWWLRQLYYVLTAGGAYLAVMIGFVLSEFSDAIRAGYVAYVAGSLVQVYGAVALWRVRNRWAWPPAPGAQQPTGHSGIAYSPLTYGPGHDRETHDRERRTGTQTEVDAP